MTEVLNFEDLLKEAKAGNAWPEGEYDFEVVEAHSVHDSSGTKPMIKAKLRALVGPYANKTVQNNFVLSPGNGAAVAIFLRNVGILGVSEQRFRELLPQINLTDPNCLEPVARAIIGGRCRIKLGHRMWQGVAQNNVEQVSLITGNLVGGPGNLASPAGAVAGPVPNALTGTGIPPAPSVPAAPAAPPAPPAAAAPPAPPAAPAAAAPPAPPVAAPLPAAAVTPQYGSPMSQPIGSPNFPPVAPVPAAPVAAAPPVAAPVAAAPVDDSPPPGLEAVWATLTPEAKTAIRAQYASAAPAAVPTGPPAPPAMPV